jgi:uncharacterized protein YutE (UPF0331/DUF86 family)
MTDVHLVLKRLTFIQTQLHWLRSRSDPSRLDDPEHRYFVLHALQLAIQSALDVASHIAADEQLGEPDRLAELFSILARERWIDAELARRLAQMAGFRNVLVHGYIEVDLAIVKDVLANRLGDLDALVEAVRARLALPAP